jgi:pimeloyl-ACP methyl ester carboxylesterase
MILRALGSGLNTASRVLPDQATRWAFALFGRSQAGAVLPAERDVHDAAKVETLSAHGQAIATYRWGEGGRPVLLVHGWNSRASRLSHFVRAFGARGIPTITFDAPGHGASTGRADILEYRAIMACLQARHGPFRAIVAHSFGAISAFYSLRTGVLAERLVSISGAAEFGFAVESFSRQLGLRPPLIEGLRRRTEAFFAPEEDIWRRFSPCHQPSEIPVPILVIHDDHDRFVTPDHAERIVSSYGARAQLVRTRDLGHARILANPAVVNEVVSFCVGPPSERANGT